MRQNRVKQLMREGKLALGTYVSFADPQIVEIIGLAGFDAAFIDMEHTSFDLPLIEEMVRAVEIRHWSQSRKWLSLNRRYPTGT